VRRRCARAVAATGIVRRVAERSAKQRMMLSFPLS